MHHNDVSKIFLKHTTPSLALRDSIEHERYSGVDKEAVAKEDADKICNVQYQKNCPWYLTYNRQLKFASR